MSEQFDGEEEQGPGGSGNHALQGYEYQIEVSIWIALDLVSANRLSDQLVLEPRSQEDLEADLTEDEPGKVTGVSEVEGYRLVVQAKRRSGDAWNEAGIRALMVHGKRRKSPQDRLADATVRYVLVTNAAVNGEARKLVVSRPGAWPAASAMPTLLKSVLPPDATGRVAIVAGKDEEWLEANIRIILEDRFRVPRADVKSCAHALREQARIRVRGAGGGVWRRREILEVIRQHNGYLADSHELDRYVYPANWEALREMMRSQSAALIVGRSGTGKTMATRKLYEELRAEIPNLKRVPITLGPTQLSSDRTVGPVLYDIEDPWGRFDFDPQSRPWNDQITRFFSAATPDRLIVATTRYDVAVSARVEKSVQPWVVPLEAEHYRRAQRRELYTSRIEDLPRNLQALAASAQEDVLKQLTTPLEIQKFFDELPIVPGDVSRNPRQLVARAIERAHEESIEQNVRLQVEQRNDVQSASVVWALLRVSDKVTTPLLIRLEDLFGDADPNYEGGLLSFVSFFIAARNLRQQDTLLSYYHPRVEAGLVQALEPQRPKLRRAIKLLVETLASFEEDGADWGLATAAKVVDATAQRFGLQISLDDVTASRMDDWISSELLKGGSGLSGALKLAAVVGSSQNRLAEFARFIEHRPDRTFPGFAYWHPPKHNDDWYAGLIQDAQVSELVTLFISDVLIDSRDYYDDCLPAELKRLSAEVTPAFLTAAQRIASYGSLGTSDVIIEGALDDMLGFEHVLDMAVAELKKTEPEESETQTLLLAIENEVYSEHYAEHLSENDDGYTANEILERYVSRLRRDGRWVELTKHRHKSSLLWHWARQLAKEETPNEVELSAAFSETSGDGAEAFLWSAVEKLALPPYWERLLARLTSIDTRVGVWEAALKCLCEREPQHLSQVISALESSGTQSRMIEIAVQLGDLQSYRKIDSEQEDDVYQAKLTAARASLPVHLQEVVTAALCLQKKQPVELSTTTCAWIAGVAEATETVRVLRLQLDHLIPDVPTEDVTWMLEHSDARNHCVLAAELAARYCMRSVIEAHLHHRFARVTAIALRYVAGPLKTTLPDQYLDMARAEASPIRLALAEILGENPQPEHVSTLLHLAADKWSRGSLHNGDPVDLPIAMAAVLALGRYQSMDDKTADELFRIGRESKDLDLQLQIFCLVIEKASERYQSEVLTDALQGTGQSTRTAARALVVQSQHVKESLANSVDIDALQRRPHTIAAMLAMLIALRASSAVRATVSERLAVSSSRRVFLLLMLYAVGDSAHEFRNIVVKLLPESHPGVQKVLAGDLEMLDGNSLDDLGDAQSVSLVLSYLKPKKPKRTA